MNLKRICLILVIWIININTSDSKSLILPICVKNGEIKWFENNKQISKVESYCYNANRFEIESWECFHNISCSNHVYKKVSYPSLLSDRGSPGFKLCKKIYGGVPKVISFKTEDDWINVSICIFENKQFIDIPTLLSRSQQ